MPFELLIAIRYLRAKRRRRAVSAITAIAVAGIVVGVAALIVAQALVSGFRRDVQERILQGTAHLNLMREDNGGIDDYRELIGRLGRVEGVAAVAPTTYVPVLIECNGRQEQAMLKGVDPGSAPEANEIFATVIDGDPRDLGRRSSEKSGESTDTPLDESNLAGLMPGRELARVLGAGPGTVVTVISARSRLTPAGLQSRPHYTKLKVVGRFASGVYEYDAKWGYLSLAEAQGLTGAGETATVIQMRVTDVDRVEEVARRVLEAAGPGYVTTSWKELNRPLFAALELQHRVIVLFFTLLIAIAALNIVTSLTMTVIEKTREIGILRAQGATPRSIGRIFLFEGAIIGVVGVLFGLILGLGVSWAANQFGWISLPAEIYSISSVTLRVEWLDCLLIALVTLAICLLATIYPSRAATRLTPVETLRYE